MVRSGLLDPKNLKIHHILLAKSLAETRKATHIFPADGVVTASVLIGAHSEQARFQGKIMKTKEHNLNLNKQ